MEVRIVTYSPLKAVVQDLTSFLSLPPRICSISNALEVSNNTRDTHAYGGKREPGSREAAFKGALREEHSRTL